MSGTQTPVNLPIFLGTIEIGVLLNAFLFGVITIQLLTYVNIYREDSWKIRGLVTWTYLSDIVHSIISLKLLWKYTILGFGNYSQLEVSQWEYTTSPMFIVITSVPIQLYLARRVMKVTANKYLRTAFFVVVALMSVAQGVLGVYLSATTLVPGAITEISAYEHYVKGAVAWSAMNFATDTLIAASLITVLLIRRTGFKSTDHMIVRIITNCVQTAIPVAICSIGHLVAIQVGTETGFHAIFAIPMGRLYTNTLLVTLNARAALRSSYQQTSTPINFLTTSMINRIGCNETASQPVRIHISRQEDVQMDIIEGKPSKEIEVRNKPRVSRPPGRRACDKVPRNRDTSTANRI